MSIHLVIHPRTIEGIKDVRAEAAAGFFVTPPIPYRDVVPRLILLEAPSPRNRARILPCSPMPPGIGRRKFGASSVTSARWPTMPNERPRCSCGATRKTRYSRGVHPGLHPTDLSSPACAIIFLPRRSSSGMPATFGLPNSPSDSALMR